MSKFILIFIIGCSFVGCQYDVLYEKNIPVNTYQWNILDTLRYDIEIKDSLQKYDLSISIRHRDQYDYTNLYINIHTLLPNGTTKSELVSLPLCDESGNWLGKCSGDICFSRILLMKKIQFPITGKYRFYITQEMRQQDLKNILDVGMRLEKSKKKIYTDDAL